MLGIAEARGLDRLIHCYLQHIHASRNRRTAQAHKICLPPVGASSDCALVVVPCAFSHMVVTFRGRRKGNLVFWCSKVGFS